MSTTPHHKGALDGSTIVSVENDPTGEKYVKKMVIKPTALDVTWGNDPRYWSIDKIGGAISLHQVSWLEVSGAFDNSALDKVNAKLDYANNYSLKFRVRMKADAFGWSGCPVYLLVKHAVDNKFKWKKVDLSRLTAGMVVDIPESPDKHTFRPPADKLIFGLFEIWRGRWKGGLEILQVIIERDQQ
ncbi:protein PHLOEM PROTEIN 2-LIKE A9-like [Musa acuminata AAA Group]|uniref:protein PHLOEM PROTEIN 2-LIKE A9-like n=1 Tax=Musa acuminata AAA Group TaxID=214697 RepID=UPI0031E0F932